jgi:predicted GH43/DUF377 family glycosyl hydrolase
VTSAAQASRPGTYSAGEALFSASNPTHLLARLDQPVFKPHLPFEKSEQYAAGTTFVEGLVYFKQKWFFYVWLRRFVCWRGCRPIFS